MTGERDLFTGLTETADRCHEERQRAAKLESENRKLKRLVAERDERIAELQIHVANLIAAAKGCWHVQARMAKKRAIECVRAA